jgi:hypothetical protein
LSSLIERVIHALTRPWKGQTLVDYGAVLVLVGIAGIGILGFLGNNIIVVYTTWLAALVGAL